MSTAARRLARGHLDPRPNVRRVAKGAIERGGYAAAPYDSPCGSTSGIGRRQARRPADLRVISGTRSREITHAFTLSRTTERSLHRMARRPNYDFEKRRKEQDRMARTEAKRAERQQRRDERQAEEAPPPPSPAPGEEQSGIVPPAV